jgi:hypothetical protein
LHEREEDQLYPQSVHANLRQRRLHLNSELDFGCPSQGLQGGDEFRDEIGNLAFAAAGFGMIEQLSDSTDSLPRIQSFRVDLLKYLSRPGYQRFGAVQEPIAGLTESRDRPEGLVELMRDTAGHFRQRGDAR